jgi:hypothetical protein
MQATRPFLSTTPHIIVYRYTPDRFLTRPQLLSRVSTLHTGGALCL